MSNTFDCPVITITREYYAGGSSLAKYLSDELGIPWYDYDFVKLASKISGYSEDEIIEEGEEISKLDIFIDKVLNSSVFYTSSHDAIFSAQKDAILELAKEPCIIVGRAANAILRDEAIPSFDIFLYADIDVRTQRAMDKHKCSEAEARKMLEKRDALRRAYYERYCGRVYGDCHEYSICLDTGVINYQQCSDILIKALENSNF